MKNRGCRRLLAAACLLAARPGLAQSGPSELRALLSRGAGYCERLKQAAFRNYCRERVCVVSRPMAGAADTSRFESDYQIVSAGGRISERRILLKENGRRLRREDAVLPTGEFSSFFPAWLPLAFLRRENQEKYGFRLAGMESVAGVLCFVLQAEPRPGVPAGTLGGRLWIECRDASVARIDIDPKTWPGFCRYIERSQQLGGRLELSASHHFVVKHEGLRFPTRTLFRETYFLPGVATRAFGGLTVREYQRTRVELVYDRYRFFNVSSRVGDQDIAGE